MEKFKNCIYLFYCLWLRFWARIVLWKVKPIIIGVTGSVGKSSAVALLTSVLEPDFKVKNTGHGNSEIGLPLEILGIRHFVTGKLFSYVNLFILAPISAFFYKQEYQVLIAEMGIDSPKYPKNMDYLLSILKPDVGMVLNIAPVHTEQFSSGHFEKLSHDEILKFIAKEKMKLALSLSKDKAAVINTDSPYISSLISEIKAKSIRIGSKGQEDVSIWNYSSDMKNGTSFTFKTKQGLIKINFPSYVLFYEYGIIIGAVFAAASEFGLKKEIISERFRNSILPPGRMSILKGVKNSMIIDSSYNSSPTSLINALDLLKMVTSKPHRVGVVGDMRELGIIAKNEHEKAAFLLSEICDRIVLVGEQCEKYILPVLVEKGFTKNNLSVFGTSQDVGKWMAKKIIREGDLILVKGSQNTIFLEEIVKDILKDRNDADKLCRQDEFWKNKKNEFFLKKSQKRIF